MSASFAKTGERYTLTFERELAHPPEKVWRALTEREFLRKWFPADVEGEWTAGAKLRFVFLHGEGEGLSDEELSGEVLTVDPPRLLEFTWGKHLLRCEVEPRGEGAVFRLLETLDKPSWGARNAAGWELCFENLVHMLQGAALAKFVFDTWQLNFKRYAAKFEPEFGPQEGAPENHPREIDPNED